MRPMGLHERGVAEPTVSLAALLAGDAGPVRGTTDFTVEDYFNAIVTGGFPGVLNLPSRVHREFLDSYIARVIDRDLPELGFAVRSPQTLQRWLRAYAAASSTTTSYSRLLDSTTGGDGTQPAKTTTLAYRDHLAQLWLLDPVPGWLPSHNQFAQLRLSPKHQLADPALAARLLGLDATRLRAPQASAMAGALFESLVTLGVRVMAQAAEASVSHLRTKAGEREVDLIVEGADGRVLAIEIKLSAAVADADVRHLLWLRDKLPDRVADLVVVNTGAAAYRRPDGVAVVPLALLGL
jgi:predicted AAA+ superfamily ATPase